MYTGLPPESYFSKEVFTLENKKIFSRLWVYAGLKSALLKEDGFITRTIAGIPVVIQNFQGEIKALKNQCPHRNAPLQTEDFGRRKLTCGYHGWNFSSSGDVNIIPYDEALYQYSPEQKKKLCLQEYKLHFVGNLIFICLSENPIDFFEQFHEEYIEKLHDLSEYFDDVFIQSSTECEFNWKLIYENLLDYNHVGFVHPRTFAPLMKNKEKKKIITKEPSLNGIDIRNLSFSRTGCVEIEKRSWRNNIDRYGDVDYFYNFFIYPNVNITSVGGYTFLIQQYHAISENRTEARFQLFTAKPKHKIRAHAAILWGHLQSEKQVFDEDAVILREVQKNLEGGANSSVHGAYEIDLADFSKMHKKLLGL